MKDRGIRFKDLLDQLDADKAYCEREEKFVAKDSKPSNGRSKEYFNGYRAACFHSYLMMKDLLPSEEVYPKIRKATDEEIKEFTIKSKRVATSMDAALNSIYGVKVEEGKEYEYEEVPYGIFEYRGEKIPVYSDDAGQQDYCIYKGRSVGGGTYNTFPEREFAYEIDRIKFYEEKGASGKDE